MVLEIRYLSTYPDVVELAGCKYPFDGKGELMYCVDTFFFKEHNCKYLSTGICLTIAVRNYS